MDSHPGTSTRSTKDSTLVFKDVCVTLNKKEILKNISGMAKAENTLAIMGPSGAGKSTLLNTLTGRIHATSGSVTLDGQIVNRTVRRKMSYVMQQDVFYPNLTLKETLTFTMMLRLPEKMPMELKQHRMQEVIDALELNKCINTIMGGVFVTGLSGGEKKRASIACELLTNPKILILDEPTSGLDSAIAYSLMATLDKYSKLSRKTVVTTIHQPSSQIFHMFTNILLLTNGEVAYFGPGRKIVDFFANLGLHCEPHYNPADFILEKVKSGPENERRILEAALALRHNEDWPVELRGGHGELDEVVIVVGGNQYNNGEVRILSVNQTLTNGTEKEAGDGVMLTQILTPEKDSRFQEVTAYQEVEGDSYIDEDATWQTGFLTQLSTLTKRDFVRSKERLLSKLNFFQILFISVFAGLVWFQTARSEETAKDRMGILFVTAILFGFLPLMDGIMIMGDDAGVFHRERSSGLYRLSAYYLSIQTTAIPVAGIGLPTLWVVIVYWMTGLMPAGMNFIAFWLITLLNVFTAQSIGMLIGVIITSRMYVLTFAQTLMIASLLAGGYYSTHIAFWWVWVKYLSFITYTLEALAIIEFDLGTNLICNSPDTTQFPQYCGSTNSTGLPGIEILRSQNLYFAPIYCSVLVLFGIAIVARIITYFVLRFLRRPRT